MIKPTTLSATLAVSLALAVGVLTHGGLLQGNESLGTSAAAFVVTSDRDAGPGTLRDAILAADRLSSRSHIVISAARISIDTPLPALINPRGTDIEAKPGAGLLDAVNQASGAVLQINSPSSSLVGLQIVNAHSSGIVINAGDVRLDSVTVNDSSVAVLIDATANGAVIRASTFERDDTGILAAADLQNLTVLGTRFRGNRRAGFWFVGAPEPRSTSASAAPAAYHPHAQIVDSTFEGNGDGVVADRPTLIQNSHFIDNTGSAVQILGGSARIIHNDIRGSRGAAISVASGVDVSIGGNALQGNHATAILVRDSSVTIDHNTLTGNAFGVVAIATAGTWSPVIQENLITRTDGDAVTLIGGTCLLQHNQILSNRGAGIRALDLTQGRVRFAATPRLEANQVSNNGVDGPVLGVYKLPASP